MSSEETYNKRDSFVELRHSNNNRAYVHSLIAELRDSLGQSQEGREYIIRQACDDVLNKVAEGGHASAFAITENAIEEMARLPKESLPRYLHYRYRYDVFPKARELDGYPPCVQIEPTSICNYRCVFCYQTDEAFTKKANGFMGTMSLDLFKSVVDQLDGNCEAVTLASRGEPLISKDLIAMLRYCGDKFLALKLNTNAWFLDEEKCHGILDSGLQTLVFSADAATEPLYSQLRVGGTLERVLQNVKQFKAIRDKHYPNSRLISRVSGVHVGSDQNLDEMQKFWGEFVDQVAFVKYNPWENAYEQPPNGITEPCSDLWRRMFVWFDGTVNPCDVDYKSKLAVGNVKDHSITTLWRSDRYESLRKQHLSAERANAFPCNRCAVI